MWTYTLYWQVKSHIHTQIMCRCLGQAWNPHTYMHTRKHTHIHTQFIFRVLPGTHYCWMARGSEWIYNLTKASTHDLLHGNRTTNHLIWGPMPQQISYALHILSAKRQKDLTAHAHDWYLNPFVS